MVQSWGRGGAGRGLTGLPALGGAVRGRVGSALVSPGLCKELLGFLHLVVHDSPQLFCCGRRRPSTCQPCSAGSWPRLCRGRW